MYHSGNQLVDPHFLFEKAHLHAGMAAADFGCGRTGHVVFPLARLLGEKGAVYAVDILKDVLESIERRAAIGSFTTVHPVWADVERVGKTAIPSRTLDVVFLVNTLWHMKHRHEALEEAARLLKDKARMVVVDWKKNALPIGPRDTELVDFPDIRNWARTHGFVVQEDIEVGPFHKGLVLFRHE